MENDWGMYYTPQMESVPLKQGHRVTFAPSLYPYTRYKPQIFQEGYMAALGLLTLEEGKE